MKLLDRKPKQLSFEERLRQYPSYKTARDKQYELQTQETALRNKLAELRAQQIGDASGHKSDVQLAAEKLICGIDAKDIPALSTERKRVNQELAIVSAAIELQTRTVREAEGQAVLAMKRENQEPHAALLRELRDRLLAVEEAGAALAEFYIATENQVFRTMRFRPFGEFNPKTKRLEEIQRWQAEAEEFDMFNDEAS
ncbi:MAG: hypothetical protein QGF59_07285 [Pirellulaceae bacterium]|nr:hypothetical protein [Planctomycetota bacterium]MDP6718433.1 hypothetical protein [Pirellulaceae bacterium]